MSSETRSICILPRLEGLGGPASFRARLINGLNRRGIATHDNPLDPTCAAVLVIGGTRHVNLVWQAHRRGVRIVQRLNGMNWMHRKRFTGVRHFVRSELNNALLAFIRGQLADAIVYQSQFSRSWWQTRYGDARVMGTVVYNGVDLQAYSPEGAGRPPQDFIRLLVVEGHLGGGHEQELLNAVEFARLLQENQQKPVELQVVGDVPAALRGRLSHAPVRLNFSGIVPRQQIAEMDRSAHLIFPAEITAACPNSVIEALACGLPVVSFATGSLPELVADDAGRVVPYGGNFWNLEPPDVPALVDAAGEVLANQPAFRRAARLRAEALFDADKMVEQYLAAMGIGD